MRNCLTELTRTKWGIAGVLMAAAIVLATQPVVARAADKDQDKKEAAKADHPAKATANQAKQDTKDAARAQEDKARDSSKKAGDAANGARNSAKQTTRETKQEAKNGTQRAEGAAKQATSDAEHAADRDNERAEDASQDADRRADDARENAPDEARTDRSSTQRRYSNSVRDENRSSRSARDRDDRRERAAENRDRSRDNIGLSFSDSNRDRLTISDVSRNGMAASAGFRRGDVIVSVDGRRVNSQNDFNRWFVGRRGRLPIIVLRDGRETTLYYDGYAANPSGGGAYLGVVLDQQNPRGAFVTRVNPDSPADQAGLQPGDEILSMNGQEIRSPKDLINEINRRSPGDEAELEVANGDQTDRVMVMLGARGDSRRYEVSRPVIEREVQPVAPVPVPADNTRIDNNRNDNNVPPARGGILRGRARNR